LTILTDSIHRYFTESSEIFTAHATITTDWPSVIYWWKYRRNNFVGKVLAGIYFFGALCPSVRLLVFFFKEVATEMGITDNQYSDRWISSVMLSVKTFPTNYVSYTDGIISSVKLFNGVVKFTPNHNNVFFRVFTIFSYKMRDYI
jgi:hypothetical protein